MLLGSHAADMGVLLVEGVSEGVGAVVEVGGGRDRMLGRVVALVRALVLHRWRVLLHRCKRLLRNDGALWIGRRAEVGALELQLGFLLCFPLVAPVRLVDKEADDQRHHRNGDGHGQADGQAVGGVDVFLAHLRRARAFVGSPGQGGRWHLVRRGEEREQRCSRPPRPSPAPDGIRSLSPSPSCYDFLVLFLPII